MTISTLTRTAAFFTFSCLFTTAACLAQGTGGGDHGSNWVSMFDPSGTIPPTGFVELDGGPPPVLGSTTSVHLTAPGFDFGFLAISPVATIGTPVHVGQDPLDLYFDPLLTLGTYALPMPGGQGQLDLPLPPDPALAGFQLAFQSLVLDPVGNLAASNLLAGNFGLIPGGPSLFAWNLGGNNGISISKNTWWNKNGTRNTVITNGTAAAKDYTLCIEKSASGGVLEIRDNTGALLGTVAGHETSTSISFTLPAGRTAHFFNSGSATINGLKWTVKVG